MDDLTPMEPEYREIPPEQPPQTPYYYGTGVQPQPKKSHLPLILTILTTLMAANILIVALALFSDGETSEEAPKKSEYLLPIYGGEDALDSATTDDYRLFESDDGLTLKGIYELYAPSSVVVTAQDEYGQHCYTGIVLTSDGYLLTDAQIASFLDNPTVTLHDGTSCEATFIGMDESCDMAILKIEQSDLTPVTLSPEEAQRTEEILENILQNARTPATLHMDISDIPEPIRIYWGLPEGVIINRLNTAGNAYRAGLRPGDVVLQIGHIAVTSVGEYLEALGRHNAGDTVRIYLYREGSTYYTDVCLDAEE